MASRSCACRHCIALLNRVDRHPRADEIACAAAWRATSQQPAPGRQPTTSAPTSATARPRNDANPASNRPRVATPWCHRSDTWDAGKASICQGIASRAGAPFVTSLHMRIITISYHDLWTQIASKMHYPLDSIPHSSHTTDWVTERTAAVWRSIRARPGSICGSTK